MTELIHEAGDAALGWLRRHLFAILGVAAALGFARAELAHLDRSLIEARGRIEELHRDFIAFRLSGAGVSKERFVEEVAERREADRRQERALDQHLARLLALETSIMSRIAGMASDAGGKR